MPTLNAYVDAPDGRVLVVTNWSDIPSARSVQVVRVHADGSTYPLRTYVWPDSAVGEYQRLSGGWAAFWDTEAPLDVPFNYRVTAVDYAGLPILVPGDYIYDNFDRTVASGNWGTPTSGGPAAWSFSGGVAADYNVAPFRGRISHGSLTTNRFQLLNGIAWKDFEVQVTFTANAPLNGTYEVWLMGRQNGTNDYLSVRVLLRDSLTNNDITIQSRQTVAGVPAGNPATIVPGVTSAGPVTIKLREQGNVVASKAWLATGTEPAAYQNFMTLTGGGLTLPPAGFGVNSNPTGSITNPLPVLMDFSNFSARSLDPVTTVYSVTSGPYTLASNGDFWLRDPVRPCNDRRVRLCFDPAATPPGCLPGNGIFFANLSPESYEPNQTTFLPTNARRPIVLARERRDAASGLGLVTRTFVDRDAVLALAQPGSPLEFVAPPAYGIPDRYMSVGTVGVSQGIPDLTFQPRLLSLPYNTVDRPVGPTQGVCGSRFMDLCDDYATWTLAAASGLSYATLVTGDPAELGFRTWATVNATWASWAAVLAAEPTWAEVLVP